MQGSELSVIALQDARTFAKANDQTLKSFFRGEVEGEDHFVVDPQQVAWFIELCKAISTVVGAGVAIGTVCKGAMSLIKFASARINGAANEVTDPLKLEEKVLVFVFEAYANARRGITTERLLALTGERSETVAAAIARLERLGVIRAGRDGSWKYRRAS